MSIALVASAVLTEPAGAVDAAIIDPVAAAASSLYEHLDVGHPTESTQPEASEDAGEAPLPVGQPAPTNHEHTEQLRSLADLVSERVPDVEPERLVAAWSTTTDQRRRVVLAALAQTGDPYRFAAAGPDAFDCSGLSTYAWGTVGVPLFHYSRRQIDDATAIDRTQLQPGDLVWRPGHVMLYLGVDDLIVNAVQPGKPVTIKRWGKVQRFGNPIHDPPPSNDELHDT